MQIEISRGRDPQIEPSYCADGWMDRLTRRKGPSIKYVRPEGEGEVTQKRI